MRCEYIFTYQDWLESVKLYRKVSKRAAIGYWLYVWILPVLSLAVSIGSFAEYLRQGGAFFGPLFWASCVGLGVALALPARYRTGLRRAFKQRNTLAKSKPMSCEFDDEKIRFVVPGGTEIAYRWESFTDYEENDKVAVLFIADAAFHTVPKRAMNQDGWAEFRELVNSHTRKD